MAETPQTVKECRRGKKAGGPREGRPWRSEGVENVGELSSIELRTWEACSQGDSGLGGWWIQKGRYLQDGSVDNGLSSGALAFRIGIGNLWRRCVYAKENSCQDPEIGW